MPDVPSVLTLNDLDRWLFDGTALAVLGQPIKHSISPALHNAALAEMSVRDSRFLTWKYFRFEVSPVDLPQALSRLHAKGFRGINLTVPHKVLAVEHLAAIDPAAQAVGAVNTLLWTKSGWHGYNTDGYGLAMGVREDLKNELAGSDIVLLGAGGAARGAAVECLRSDCASLWIGNRTPENRAALLGYLQPIAAGTRVRSFAPDAPPKDLPPNAIVINATSAGLRETDAAPVDLASIPRPRCVYDMIYNPPVTALLRAAQTSNIPHANGLSMLVHQGARALEIWSDADVPVAVMRAAAVAALPR